MKNTLRLALVAMPTLAAVTLAHAGTATVDGMINVGDGYGGPVKVFTNYFNGVDASGGFNVVSAYYTFDATKVYGALHLDAGANGGIPGANVYVYSGASNGGTFGDGDDIILQGGNGYAKALNQPPYSDPNPPKPYDGLASYAFNGSDTVEFSVARSLLGSQSTLSIGGQFFAYEFHLDGSRDGPAVVPLGSPASVPLPAAVVGGAGLFATLASRRRRT